MHRGVLAGMTPEEREAAVSDHYRQSPSLPDSKIQDELNDSYLYVHEPERTLLGTFLLMNKKELCDMARQESTRGYSKLVKLELTAELWNHYEEMRYSLPHSFGACTPGLFDLAERTYRAGGMLEISRAEHDALPLSRRWLPCVPFLNVLDCDDKLYAVIPSEFMEKTSDEQWVDAIREHRGLEHARHLTNTYLERCGLVEQGALTEVYRRYYPGELDAAGFEDFLWLNGPSSFERYNLGSVGKVGVRASRSNGAAWPGT